MNEVINMPDEKKTQSAPAEKPKRKGGRQAMTPEEKAAAAKARAEEKKKAESMKPEVFVQVQGGEISLDALVDAAKDDFHQTKKRTRVTALKLYVKPEEFTAYYVVNDGHEGKITF